MNMSEYMVVLFHSTNYAVWASDVLKRSDIWYKMVPVPRHLSSDCGSCVLLRKDDEERVRVLLDDKGIEYDRFAPHERD